MSIPPTPNAKRNPNVHRGRRTLPPKSPCSPAFLCVLCVKSFALRPPAYHPASRAHSRLSSRTQRGICPALAAEGLRRPPQPIQQREQQDPKRRGHQRIHQLLPRKKSRRMIQQHPLRDHQNRLMKMKEQKYQSKPAHRMLGIDPAPDRRRHVPHDRLRDPVHPDRIVVRQRVLRDANRPAQKHSGDRIPPAEPEINRHQQRQVDQLRPPSVFVQEGLKHQRQQRHSKNRAAVKLVDLNVAVRPFADIQHVIGTHISAAPPYSPPRRAARLPCLKAYSPAYLSKSLPQSLPAWEKLSAAVSTAQSHLPNGPNAPPAAPESTETDFPGWLLSLCPPANPWEKYDLL